MCATEDSYKGQPTLKLTETAEDRFGLTFGLKKARLILNHLDEIRAFEAKHSSPAPE